NDRKWNPDLIVFDSSRSYGIPSYYVQKLFSLNRPDIAYPVEVTCESKPEPVLPGKIGLGTWRTQSEYKDVKLTGPGGISYETSFADGAAGWRVFKGDWKVADGIYRQTSMAEDV